MDAAPESNRPSKNTIVKRLEEDFFEYLENVDPDTIKIAERDTGNYKKIKYTILPKGTKLRFRSKKQLYSLDPKPIWAEYSSLLGKESYLDEAEGYTKVMESAFGSYINTIETLQDLIILHFPIHYGKIQTPIANRNTRAKTQRIKRNMNISADIEGLVHLLCVPDEKRNRYPNMTRRLMKYIGICRDGYTLDMFYKVSGHSLRRLKEIRNKDPAKMAGFREICLTNVSSATVRLVSSEYLPV